MSRDLGLELRLELGLVLGSVVTWPPSHAPLGPRPLLMPRYRMSHGWLSQKCAV